MNRVILLPQVIIEANGVPLPAKEVQAITEVRVQQRLSLPTLCELTFCHSPGSPPLTLVPGMTLRILLPKQQTPLFNGQVTAVAHHYGPAREVEIRVRGYDVLHCLRKRQTVRAYIQVTLCDLAQELVTDLGLTVQAAAPGPFWPRLFQYHASDLDLLVEIAGRYGLYLTVRENVLHLLSLAGSGETVPLALGASLLEAHIEVNGDPACRAVATTGWDTLHDETHVGQATTARSGRSIAAAVPPHQVGGHGQRHLLGLSLPDDHHALGAAQAELDRCLAREVTLWGVAEGDARLQPGVGVVLGGVAALLAGRYVLTEVTHIINGQMGFISEIATVPPPPRPRPRGTAVTPGMVTQVDDPENLGRVRVCFPAYGDVESDWLGVVCAGAGDGKGVAILPDVGDTVLVALVHEDPGHSVILGGLYGAQSPPDSGIVAGHRRRYTIQTPGGQRVHLADNENTLRLENSTGSYIDLTPDKVRIHANADLEIEAPGRSVIIRGKAIDFQKA